MEARFAEGLRNTVYLLIGFDYWGELLPFLRRHVVKRRVFFTKDPAGTKT